MMLAAASQPDAVQDVLQDARQRDDEQQDEEHPVGLVRVLVLRRRLLDAACAGRRSWRTRSPTRGQVAEDVHAPVDRRPRLPCRRRKNMISTSMVT